MHFLLHKSGNYSKFLTYFTLSLLPLIYIESLYSKTELPRFSFIAFLVIPAFIFLVIDKINSSSLNWHKNILFFGLLIFVYAISILWGSSYGNYEDQLIKLIVFSFTFLLGTQLYNLDFLKKLLFIAVSIASIISIIGISQKFFFKPLNLFQFGTGASTFVNANFAANYLDLIIPINFILLINSKSKKTIWVLSGTLCLLLSHILIINSRASFLALIVFFIATLIASQKLSYFNEKLAVFSKNYKSLILLLFFIPFLLNITPGTSAGGLSWKKNEKSFTDVSSYSPSSSTIRFNAYLTSLDMIKDNPLLGVGLGNFHISFRSYAQAIDSKHKVNRDLVYLHNEILQTIVEIGIIGGSIFILIIVNTLVSSLRHISHSPNSQLTNNQVEEKLLALGLLLALLASGTHTLLSFPLHQATSGFLFYLWLGLLTGLLSVKIKINKNIKINFKIILVFTLLGIAYIYNHYNNQLKSNYYINKAMLSFNNENCEEAVKFVDKSMNYYAKDYYPQRWAISIYGSCDSIAESKKLLLAEKILSNNPLHPWALKMAAVLYFKKGDYASSEKALRLITILYPSLPASYIELGNVLYLQNQYSAAYDNYQKALLLSPQHPIALKMMKKVDKKLKINNHK